MSDRASLSVGDRVEIVFMVLSGDFLPKRTTRLGTVIGVNHPFSIDVQYDEMIKGEEFQVYPFSAIADKHVRVVNDPRNTQFSGFAKLLIDELREKAAIIVVPNEAYDYIEPIIQRIIAQRAYDFACHIVSKNTLMARHDMSKIPDLTEWEAKE